MQLMFSMYLPFSFPKKFSPRFFFFFFVALLYLCFLLLLGRCVLNQLCSMKYGSCALHHSETVAAAATKGCGLV